MSKFFEIIRPKDDCENCSRSIGFKIRISPFKNEDYVGPIDFKTYNGLVAKYFVLLFRVDDYAKEKYSFKQRLIKFKMKLPHQSLIAKMKEYKYD